MWNSLEGVHHQVSHIPPARKLPAAILVNLAEGTVPTGIPQTTDGQRQEE